MEPLEGSEYEKNDTLDNYIYEQITPIKKITHHNFKKPLSPVEEIEETDIGQEGGGDADHDMFIAFIIMHGGYPIDNFDKPVTEITQRSAPLIVPRNDFDGFEYLTICSAPPASQTNGILFDVIKNVYDPVVRSNIERFSTLLSEKVESVEMTEEPVLVKPSHVSVTSPITPSKTPSRMPSKTSSKTSSRTPSRTPLILRSSSSPNKVQNKKYKLPASSNASPSVSRVSNLIGIVKSVSHSVKSKLFSLVRGCIKMAMNFNVDYAILDVSDATYNRIQRQVVNAIICMNKNGFLKINSDVFDAFSYSLFNNLRKRDHQVFEVTCRYGISQSTPGTMVHDMRVFAYENLYQRFPCIRVLVKDGKFQPKHIEKNYYYHPVNDADPSLYVRVYKYSMTRKKSINGKVSILPKVDFFDISLDDVFEGSRKLHDGNYIKTSSQLFSTLSLKINEHYYRGKPVKISLSVFDLSCSFFSVPQQNIPITTGREGWWGLGSFRPKLGGNKTKRKSMRNKRKERRGRSNSKIRNRRLSRQTRKNRRRS